jgi:hypothetical protein
VIHHASPAFWSCHDALSAEVRALADKEFALLKENPKYPSLHFKRVKRFRSARVGANYRALAVDVPDGILWFWIGSNADYDRLVAERCLLQAGVFGSALRAHRIGSPAEEAGVRRRTRTRNLCGLR